jgi:hypothetical protein
MYGSKEKLAKLNYTDIKLLLDRRIVKNKRGSLTERKIQMLVKDWHDRHSEGELRQETIEMKTKSMEKKLRKYNVEQLGEMPLEREDGTMRILVCQMGGCASAEAREFKIASTEKLIHKYDINVCLFVELNFNWTKVNPQQTWLRGFARKKEKCAAPLLTTLRSLTNFSANINRGVQGWCADTNSYNTRGSHLQTPEGWGDGAHGHSSAIPLTLPE